MHNKGLSKTFTLKELHDVVFSKNSMLVQIRFSGLKYKRVGVEGDQEYWSGSVRGPGYEYVPLFIGDERGIGRCFNPFWDIGDKCVIDSGITETISTRKLPNGSYYKLMFARCEGQTGWMSVDVLFSDDDMKVYHAEGIDRLLRLFAITIFFRGEV